MKGTIFVELLSMAENAFGEDVVDSILDKTDLESGGAYTTVGNYPCEELVKIVMAFSEHSGISPVDLQKMFGHWVFKHFTVVYPEMVGRQNNAFAMLESIETEIHVEVKKLYPQAELPSFQTKSLGADKLEMIYSSERPLGAFCEGMIEACVEHFGENATIAGSTIAGNENATRFEIQKTT